MNAGDLVFVTSSGFMGKGIRWAQRRNHEPDWKLNHVAVLYQPLGDDWFIIQAEASGVTDNKLLSSIAPGGTYKVVSLPTSVNPEQFLAFLRSQVGTRYGWLSIASRALDMFLPTKLCLRMSNTWICSGLVAAALWFCGFAPMENVPDMYSTTPAQIARACGS